MDEAPIAFRRALLSLIALAPTTLLAQPSLSAASEVRAARLAQNAALAARRLDSAASFWADDVVITSGLGRIIRGKVAYRQAFDSDSTTVFVRTPVRIESATPWLAAWEEGLWVSRRGPNGPVLVRGRYAAQWRKVGSRWLIRSELFVALRCSGAACERPLAPSPPN